MLASLNPSEICQVLDTKFEQPLAVRKLILKRMISDLAKGARGPYIALFERLMQAIETLSSYHSKEACSIFLHEMSFFMSSAHQKRLTEYFLKSRYVNNRKRAYRFLLKSKDLGAHTEVISSAWHEHKDPECLELLIEVATEEFIVENWPMMEKYFAEEDSWYDLEYRILRNKFYIKASKYFSAEIKALKKGDPISYIYVMKGLGNKIEASYAVGVYQKFQNSRKYLPTWYGEMGLRDVLAVLGQFQNELNQQVLS